MVYLPTTDCTFEIKTVPKKYNSYQLFSIPSRHEIKHVLRVQQQQQETRRGESVKKVVVGGWLHICYFGKSKRHIRSCHIIELNENNRFSYDNLYK